MTGGRGGSLVVVVVVVKGGEGEEMIKRGEVLLEEEPKRPVDVEVPKRSIVHRCRPM